VWGIVGVVLLAAVWELYKIFGPEDGVVVFSDGSRGSGVRILPRSHDRAMPHIWEMAAALFRPGSGGDSQLLGVSVLNAMMTTLGIAAAGLAIGLVVGVLLALVMQRWRIVEWGILPWVVVSQTVPLIAFAPLVNSIGIQLEDSGAPWNKWLSVALIASYLAFFPIAIGMLRGLQAPDRIHLELMHSYAAGHLPTLLKLRLPAAVPYLLPALRLGAANAIVGAVVAEVSIAMPGGLGRMLIGLAGQASADPAKPWGPIFGSVALGLLAAGSVALLGALLGRYRRGEVPA